MISKEEVESAQQSWGNGVIEIGSLKSNSTACQSCAAKFIEAHYAFDSGNVLFKPTKCAEEQFRSQKAQALSYFVAGKDRHCKEDQGFALQPWIAIRFENFGLILEENRAIAMGNYYFTNSSNNETKVEYTFGYRKIEGILKIDLHHSSFPFSKP